MIKGNSNNSSSCFASINASRPTSRAGSSHFSQTSSQTKITQMSSSSSAQQHCFTTSQFSQQDQIIHADNHNNLVRNVKQSNLLRKIIGGSPQQMKLSLQQLSYHQQQQQQQFSPLASRKSPHASMMPYHSASPSSSKFSQFMSSDANQPPLRSTINLKLQSSTSFSNAFFVNQDTLVCDTDATSSASHVNNAPATTNRHRQFIRKPNVSIDIIALTSKQTSRSPSHKDIQPNTNNRVMTTTTMSNGWNSNTSIRKQPTHKKYTSSTATLTTALNDHYEKAMNQISTIENRRFGLDSNPSSYSPMQFSNLPQQHSIRSQQISFSTKQNYDSNNDDNDNSMYSESIHEMSIMTPQKEPAELLTKQYVVNLIRAETLEFFYCFVNVRLMPTPVRISFKTSVSKLRVFVSKTTPFPSKFSHDDVFQTNEIRIDDEGKRKFSFEKIYLGALSETEQEVRIKVRFGFSDKSSSSSNGTTAYPVSNNSSSYAMRSPSNRILTTDHSSSNGDSNSSYMRVLTAASSSSGGVRLNKIQQISTQALAVDVAEILEKRRRKRMVQKHGAEKDFQLENIKQVEEVTMETLREQIEQRSNVMNSKIRDVIEKKRLIDEQNFFKRDCQLRCRDFQRVINMREQVKNTHSKHLAQLANAWTKLLLSVLGFRYFISKDVVRMRKTMRSAFSLKRRVAGWKRCVKRDATDIMTRTLITSRVTLGVGIAYRFKKLAKQQAISIVIDLLRDKKEVDSIVNRVDGYLATSKQIRYEISSKWKEYRAKLANFKAVLGYLFDKYFSTVLEQISKGDSDRQNFTEVLSNARKIDKVKTEKTREAFIKYYLARRRTEYYQALYQYFLMMHQLNPKKFQVLQALITKRYEQQELDFKEVVAPQERAKDIENILFNQVIDKLRSESLKPPRFFIVPSYEVLKRAVKETFVQVQDVSVVQKLREEQQRKNWSEAMFLKKLIQFN